MHVMADNATRRYVLRAHWHAIAENVNLFDSHSESIGFTSISTQGRKREQAHLQHRMFPHRSQYEQLYRKTP